MWVCHLFYKESHIFDMCKVYYFIYFLVTIIGILYNYAIFKNPVYLSTINIVDKNHNNKKMTKDKY